MILPHKYGTLTIKDSSINGYDVQEHRGVYEICVFRDKADTICKSFENEAQYKDACVKLDELFDVRAFNKDCKR